MKNINYMSDDLPESITAPGETLFDGDPDFDETLDEAKRRIGKKYMDQFFDEL